MRPTRKIKARVVVPILTFAFVAAWQALPSGRGDDAPQEFSALELRPRTVQKSERIAGQPVLGEGPLNATTVGRIMSERILNEFKANDKTLTKGVTLDIERVDARQFEKKWYLVYPLAYQKIPFSRDSSIKAVLLPELGPGFLETQNLPLKIDIPNDAQGLPAARLANAKDVILRELGSYFKQKATDFKAEDFQFEAEPREEVWVNPENMTGHLSYLAILTKLPRGKEGSRLSIAVRIVVYDPNRVSLVELRSLTQKSHHRIVYAAVWDPTPLEEKKERPLKRVRIVRDQPKKEDLTRDQGAFDFRDGTGDATLSVELDDDWFEVLGPNGDRLAWKHPVIKSDNTTKVLFQDTPRRSRLDSGRSHNSIGCPCLRR
jgi:hypothetical protein